MVQIASGAIYASSLELLLWLILLAITLNSFTTTMSWLMKYILSWLAQSSFLFWQSAPCLQAVVDQLAQAAPVAHTAGHHPQQFNWFKLLSWLRDIMLWLTQYSSHCWLSVPCQQAVLVQLALAAPVTCTAGYFFHVRRLFWFQLAQAAPVAHTAGSYTI
jgi:hypothetical protein